MTTSAFVASPITSTIRGRRYQTNGETLPIKTWADVTYFEISKRLDLSVAKRYSKMSDDELMSSDLVKQFAGELVTFKADAEKRGKVITGEITAVVTENENSGDTWLSVRLYRAPKKSAADVAADLLSLS